MREPSALCRGSRNALDVTSFPLRPTALFDPRQQPLERCLQRALGAAAGRGRTLPVTKRGGHLQHGRLLAFAQPRHQDDFTVGEFQRVVMDARLLHIDLPETRQALAKLNSLPAAESTPRPANR